MKVLTNHEKLISEFEKRINYVFINKENIFLALTHSSYANENKHFGLKSNERIEFLGDSVLNIIISENVYKNCSNLKEGEMTKVRASIVCESSLAKCANELKLGDFLLIGKGEEMSGGRIRASILSDAFEAVIGAIYLDGDLLCAKEFVINQMKELIDSAIKGFMFMDYKTELQELVQSISEYKLVYEVIEEKGPDHSKVFVCHVRIANKVLGIGEGRTKKEAEQNSAKYSLDKRGEWELEMRCM